MSIGAATLADLYEPAERGTMMGIYYWFVLGAASVLPQHGSPMLIRSAPLLGPSLGPILGGALTQGFNWRATFWFLTIFTGLCTLSFVFFRDTFRRERSLTYQSVLKRVLEQEAKKAVKQAAAEKAADIDDARTAVVPMDEKSGKDAEGGKGGVDRDVEAQTTSGMPQAVKEVKPSLKDVNPIGPMLHVLNRPNNVVILFASGKSFQLVFLSGRILTLSLTSKGLLFAFNFSITYTASRTLANEYHYDALDTGFVLLAYGIGVLRPTSDRLFHLPYSPTGCLLGSVLGGRYSDHIFRKLKAKHGGKSQPEARTLYSAHTRWMVHAYPASLLY